MLAGLTFFNLGPGAESVQKRLGLLFFTLLLFELLPFCYMSFYVEDRRFFAADVASDLYHPSAYYVATVREFFFLRFRTRVSSRARSHVEEVEKQLQLTYFRLFFFQTPPTTSLSSRSSPASPASSSTRWPAP